MRQWHNVAPTHDRAFIEGEHLDATIFHKFMQKSARLVLGEATDSSKVATLPSDNLDTATKSHGIVGSAQAELHHGNHLAF